MKLITMHFSLPENFHTNIYSNRLKKIETEQFRPTSQVTSQIVM